MTFIDHKRRKTQTLWLINMRWIAVLGLIAAICFGRFLFHLNITIILPLVVTTIIAIYNSVFLIVLSVHKKPHSAESKLAYYDLLILLQIFFDLLCLGLIIHFTGGIENPFIFYFVFHTVIASVCLSRPFAFLQALFSVIILLFIAFFEYFQIIPHYILGGPFKGELYQNIFYVHIIGFIFASTVFISAYMASRLAESLRQKELQLLEANVALKEKDKIKSQYVLQVTHDIKGHLAAISGNIDPVRQGYTGSLNEKQWDLLSRAEARTDKLLSYVKDLLQITRIKLMNKLELVKFSMDELLEDVLVDVRDIALSKKIKLKEEIKPELGLFYGVKVYIKELLLNLLSNAIKYSKTSGEVLFKVSQDFENIIFIIEDHGIGIPEKDRSSIFDEFFRASNAIKSDKSGSGLGLALIQKIVQIHGGQIQVDSTENVGTTFIVHLPQDYNPSHFVNEENE